MKSGRRSTTTSYDTAPGTSTASFGDSRRLRNSWGFVRREPSALRLARGKDKRGPGGYQLDDGGLDLVRISDDFDNGYTIIRQSVAAHFGLETDATAIERMSAESRFSAKDPVPRVFAGDAAQRRPITRQMRKAAQRFTESGYRRLAAHA
jgi:hypothetical protein